MKFDVKHSEAAIGHERPASEYPGGGMWKSPGEGPCSVCKETTDWMELSKMVFICSEECYEQKV